MRYVTINRKLSGFLDWKICGRKLSWPVLISCSFIYLNELRDTKNKSQRQKKNSVALVRERTIPTERPPPVGEVSANFCG